MSQSSKQESVIASIDIGSNSAHLVVAKVDRREAIEIIDTDKITLRLASYLSPNRYLSKDGIEKCMDALSKLMSIAKTHTDNIRCVATYTIRAAKNKNELISIAKDQLGIDIEVVKGKEEAWLEYLGVHKALKLEGTNTILVDIGGGSTEVSFHEKDSEDLKFAMSLSMGAVTLTEKFLKDKEHSPKTFEKLERHIQSQMAGKLEIDKGKIERAVASSGTAKAIGRIVNRVFHENKPLQSLNGFVFSTEELAEVYKQLRNCESPQEISQKYPVDEARSEIILAGVAILYTVSKYLKIKSWIISNYSLREGLVVDTYRRWFSDDSQKYANTRLQSIRKLGERFNIDPIRGRMILKKTLLIYDQLIEMDDYKKETFDNERILLQAACYLCEVGKTVNYSRYHKHSAYVVQNCDIIGFTQPELLIIGYIIKHHRKSVINTKKLEEHPALIPFVKRLQLLSMCLRLGVALNRTWQRQMMYSSLEVKDSKFIFSFPESFKDSFEVELDKIKQESAACQMCLGKSIEIKFD